MLQNAQANETKVLAPGDHFGQVKSVHSLGSLIVAECYYQPLFQTPFHFHETASFTMVFGGGYQEQFSKKHFECKTGSTLYRPAGEVHRDRMGGGGAHCLMVEMPSEWVQRIAVRGLCLGAPRHAGHSCDLPGRIRREITAADELSPMVVEALVIELACAMEREPFRESHIPRWLRQLRERIEAEFTSLPRLDTLANDLGLHPGHMVRAFRQHFGCTIGEYARRRKIEYCCEQLCGENPSLCEVAAKAGFSSQAHLTRLFKLHTGMTPGEFRRTRSQRNFGVKM